MGLSSPHLGLIASPSLGGAKLSEIDPDVWFNDGDAGATGLSGMHELFRSDQSSIFASTGEGSVAAW